MPSEPHFIDCHVGRRLKMRRLVLGLSQERLGELLGLTFQQIQKYERGANRLGASRLYEAAQALDVDVGFFFDEVVDHANGLEEDAMAYAPAGFVDIAGDIDANIEGRRETLELVRAFERISDTELRKRLLEVIKAIADLD